MVERGIRIVGMMDYIDANSKIFFEYSLRAQGIFEEVVPAHRNEKGPCHRPHRLFGYRKIDPSSLQRGRVSIFSRPG